ncbi:MAG: M1 family metallopeptidase [Thermoanaerobaculia bacterium]
MSCRSGTAWALAILLWLSSEPVAGEPTTREAYDGLQEWSFAKTASPLPPAGLGWSIGEATIELSEGSIRRQKPTPSGATTGFVFEGRGTIKIEVEDPVELRQLGRFMEKPVRSFEAEFTELVARSHDLGFLNDLESVASPYAPNPVARERHDHWLRIRRHDADARVVAALANPDDSYFRADFKTGEHGWVTLDFDRGRYEELHLSVFRNKKSVVENWLSLDVEADSPSPGSVDLEHFDCSVRLIKTGRDANFSEASRTTLIGEFVTTSRFRAGRSGDRAVRLFLHPMARVDEVRDGQGRTLAFLRNNIGGRSRALDKRLHDASLVVLLAEPTESGAGVDLSFEYELEVTNYMPGRSWYPVGERLERGPSSRHTAAVSIETRDEFDIRAMGELESDLVEGSVRTARWRVDTPAKMITFAITRKMEERTTETAAGPTVIVFGPPVGHDTEARLHALGADVANSISFFQELFDEPLPAETLYATLIQGGHGQAFDGFLHLSEGSAFRTAKTGVVELFLAHEVAHQWWGHLVGWSSYRDQWLSEGLAQYAAMMFIEAILPKGEKIFDEIVEAYRDELTGSMSSSMSHFTSFDRIQTNRVAQARIGPIALGYRAATAEAPGAYQTQTYRKGALVAHMLRTVLSFMPNGEEVFRRVLRGFVDRYKNGSASTADLAAEVARHAPGDWTWFFEQWVNRAEIPTYRWNARIGSKASAEGSYPVELTVKRGGVSDDFKMYVPVEADFGKDRKARVLVNVDDDTKTFALSFPERPRKIVFNPEAAVLARTERSRK